MKSYRPKTYQELLKELNKLSVFQSPQSEVTDRNLTENQVMKNLQHRARTVSGSPAVTQVSVDLRTQEGRDTLLRLTGFPKFLNFKYGDHS